MTIDKDTILQLLHSKGQGAQADQAAQELPDQVDPTEHSGLLAKFGIDPAELIAKFTGGGGNGGAGGLGGALGKLL